MWLSILLKINDFCWEGHRKMAHKYNPYKLIIMLRWTVTFIILAIIAAVFGFGGIAAGAASIAKILFFIFLILFVISLFTGRRKV